MTPAPPVAAKPDAATRAAQAAVLVALAALAALCIAWEAWIEPTGRRTLVVKALPLLLCLPGVLRHRLYTYRVLALLVWLYVLEGAVRFAPSSTRGNPILAMVEIMLAITLFVACAAYIRWRLRRGRQAAGDGSGPAARPSESR